MEEAKNLAQEEAKVYFSTQCNSTERGRQVVRRSWESRSASKRESALGNKCNGSKHKAFGANS